MDESSSEGHCDFPSLSNAARTILLVGGGGSGKSATGNSILGRKAFKLKFGFRGTRTPEMQSTVLEDGKVIKVIDTVGIVDPNLNTDEIGREIVTCIGLAKNGIHAMLLVLSVRMRFYRDARELLILQHLFGPKIINYMIVVFTRGDELEENDDTFDDFLRSGFAEPLQNVLTNCKGRCVVFDNKTRDRDVIMKQRQKLLDLIEVVVQENGGQPYTDSIFTETEAARLRAEEKAQAD